MVVNGAPQPVSRPECEAQIAKLASSEVLHGSDVLCRLLRYLAEQAIDHPGTPLKEYQIAREAFGRPADFDPQSDATVRVHAGRLRSKLEEYYRSDGNDDLVRVELPKGGYTLYFHRRVSDLVPEAPAPPRLESSQPVRAWRPAAVSVTALSLALAAALIGIAVLMVRKPSPAPETAPSALRVFWKPFLSSPDDPWVIFSNAAFVGRPETGIRYFDPSRDSPDVILDHYTGVGEVLAVHSLDRAFAMLRRPIRVKRGRLLSLDDAQNNNLVFVGSPAENLTLQDIPGPREFPFKRLTDGPHKGELAILNRQPRRGEPGLFLSSAPNEPLSEDYALVALLPGLAQGRYVLILAGETTLGTEAAAEYVCDPDGVARLLAELKVPPAGSVGPFESVLRVSVRRGVPMRTELVALRNGF